MPTILDMAVLLTQIIEILKCIDLSLINESKWMTCGMIKPAVAIDKRHHLSNLYFFNPILYLRSLKQRLIHVLN